MSIVIRGKRLSSVLVAALLVGSGLLMILPAVPVAGASGVVTCGTTITKSTTLKANLVDCSEDGIIIGASGITLNCAGHSISWGEVDSPTSASETPSTVGVLSSGRSHVTVENCNVYDFDSEIYFTGGSYNTFSGNTVSDDQEAGIYLVNEAHDTVTGNTAYDNYWGYALQSSTYVTLTGNYGFSNYNAFNLACGSHNTLSSNIATDNAEGYHMFAETSDTLTGNYAQYNGNGFSLNEGGLNTLVKNTGSYNGFNFGFYVYEEYNDTFTQNVAKWNDGHGFLVYDGEFNVFNGNTAYANGGSGFHVQYEVGDTFTANVASFNSVEDDSAGFYLYENCGTNMTGNISNNNGGAGYYAYDEAGNECSEYTLQAVWSGNTANSDSNGFNLQGGSYGLILTHNLAGYNNDWGFLDSNAADNTYGTFGTPTGNICVDDSSSPSYICGGSG